MNETTGADMNLFSGATQLHLTQSAGDIVFSTDNGVSSVRGTALNNSKY